MFLGRGVDVGWSAVFMVVAVMCRRGCVLFVKPSSNTIRFYYVHEGLQMCVSIPCHIVVPPPPIDNYLNSCDCLEDKRNNYEMCFLLYCATHCCASLYRISSCRQNSIIFPCNLVISYLWICSQRPRPKSVTVKQLIKYSWRRHCRQLAVVSAVTH